MPALQPIAIPERLRVVATLAQLLEKLEHSAEPVSADQYLLVVEHLQQALSNTEPDAYLEQVLTAFPAAGMLYENLRYAQAGLCRQPLEQALQAELLARDVLKAAAQA